MKKGITTRLKGKAPVIGKKDRVYVGLDVHKRSIHAAVRINGVEHGTAVLTAQPKAVVAFLEPYVAGLKMVVYEAGPTGFGLARALKDAGIRVGVVPPSKIPRPAVRTAKSDKMHPSGGFMGPPDGCGLALWAAPAPTCSGVSESICRVAKNGPRG